MFFFFLFLLAFFWVVCFLVCPAVCFLVCLVVCFAVCLVVCFAVTTAVVAVAVIDLMFFSYVFCMERIATIAPKTRARTTATIRESDPVEELFLSPFIIFISA